MFRTASWLVYGARWFTASGYERSAQGFDARDDHVDCSNRSYVVTGANSGIGHAVALNLAKRGATVHMVCRSPQRGEEALLAICRSTGSKRVHLHTCDLSELSDIRRFAREFASGGHKADTLINNAGGMAASVIRTREGAEQSFATNVLGTYYMTHALLPLMQASCAAQTPSPTCRVITVSSGGMYTVALDHRNLDSLGPAPLLQPSTSILNSSSPSSASFDGTMAYAQHKRCQVEMTERWAQCAPAGVQFLSMHPGWADTPGVATAMPGFRAKFEASLRSSEQGADTVIWLATRPYDHDLQNGAFYFDRSVAKRHLPLAGTQVDAAAVDEMFVRVKGACESVLGEELRGFVATGHV